MSSHMESGFNIEHNNRTIPVPHSDKKYEEENNYYYEKNQTLPDAYEKLFGDAFREYNDTIRKDRREKSYLDKLLKGMAKEQEKVDKLRAEGKSFHTISKAKRTVKPAYELIFAFGNIDDNPEFGKGGSMQGKAKAALEEYVKGFQKRNPNVYLFNASIHTGEQGVCHLHADVIFWADGFQRGQKRQCNMTKALNAMGYYTKEIINPDGTVKTNKNGQPMRVNAITQWQDHERQILREIARRYDIEVVPGKHSRSHRDIATFQLEQEQKKLQQEKAAFDEFQSGTFEQLDETRAKHEQREKALNAREDKITDMEQILRTEAVESINELKTAVKDAMDNFKGSTGTRANEYPPAKLTKGCRAVPEKELEQLVESSWYRPDYVKNEMQKVIDKFNELPFIRSARKQIYGLKEQIHELKEQVIKLKVKIISLQDEIKQQQVFINKAKEMLGVNGRSFYEKINAAIERDRQENRDEHDFTDYD